MTERETPGPRDVAAERKQLEKDVRDRMRPYTKPFEPEAIIPPEPNQPTETD